MSIAEDPRVRPAAWAVLSRLEQPSASVVGRPRHVADAVLAGTVGGTIVRPRHGTDRSGELHLDRRQPLVPAHPGHRLHVEGRDRGRQGDRCLHRHPRHQGRGRCPCVVVDDRGINGVLEERTFDWYAQDRPATSGTSARGHAGARPNGERTSTEGTWHGRCRRGRPGIYMAATPRRHAIGPRSITRATPRTSYVVKDLRRLGQGPYGAFKDVLLTEGVDCPSSRTSSIASIT